MHTHIEINGLRLYAHHGVMAQEARVGNLFEVSMSLKFKFDDSDRLDLTVNYAEAVAVVKEVMAWRADLIETVAVRLRDALVERFPQITGGRVSVAKLAPPIPSVELGSVAAVVEW